MLWNSSSTLIFTAIWCSDYLPILSAKPDLPLCCPNAEHLLILGDIYSSAFIMSLRPPNRCIPYRSSRWKSYLSLIGLLLKLRMSSQGHFKLPFYWLWGWILVVLWRSLGIFGFNPTLWWLLSPDLSSRWRSTSAFLFNFWNKSLWRPTFMALITWSLILWDCFAFHGTPPCETQWRPRFPFLIPRINGASLNAISLFNIFFFIILIYGTDHWGLLVVLVIVID